MSLVVAPPEAQAATDSDTGAYIVPVGTRPRTYMSNTMLSSYQASHPGTVFVYMSNFKNPEVVKLTGACADDGNWVYIKRGKGDSKTGTFTIVYSNTAYTAGGQKVDVVLEGVAEMENTVTEDEYIFKHDNNSANDFASSEVGVHITLKVKMYLHGTYDKNTNTGRTVEGIFGMYFNDLDQQHGSSETWDEAITLKTGYVNGYMCMGEAIPNAQHTNQAGDCPSQGGRLATDKSTHGSQTWLRFSASHTCASETDSEMAFLVKDGTTLMWSGTNCGTSIGLLSSGATPEWPTQKYVTLGENDFSNETYTTQDATVRFTIVSNMPYVPNSSAPQSIVLEDTFEAPFDVANATVTVWRQDMNGNYSRVTSDWTKSVSGQKLTLTCNNLADAEGQHQFVILIPFKSGYDFSSLPTVDFDGTKYKHTTNNAKMTAKKVDGTSFTKNTQTVDVYVGFDGGVSVQKSSSLQSMTNGNPCYSLAGAKYGVYRTQADANAGTNSLGTLTTTASGASNQLNLASGTYWLKETVASPGYALNSTPVSFTVTSGNPVVVTMTEPPKADNVVLSVVKRPSDTSKSYNMAGARFKVEYYNNHLTAAQVASTTPTRVWYIDTANSGSNLGIGDMNHNLIGAISDETYMRSGSAYPVIPLGTVAVTEISPPAGFELGNPKTVIYHVNDDGSDTALTASRSNVQNYTAGSGYTYSVSNVLSPMSTNTPVNSSKGVSKSIASVDEQITYTITYPITSTSGNGAYRSIAFADTLPKFASYDVGSFEVYNTDGSCVTPCGTLTVNSTNGRDALRFDFDSTWVADGITRAGNLTFTFTATVKDPGHQSGYYSLKNKGTVLVNGSAFETDEVETKVPVWWIDLTKISTNPTISNANPDAYTLAGAKFSVTRTDGYSPGYITTDAQGKGSLRVVKLGSYKIKEIVAPKGFAASDQENTVTLTYDNCDAFTHVTTSFSNEPLYATRAAQKMDNEYLNVFNPSMWNGPAFHYDDKNDWQGNVPNFEGMELRARYFANYTWSPQHKAEAYWTSDASGYVDMPNNAPSSGTWPYQMHGQNVIPLGSFEFVETTAPTGMLVDSTPHRCTIKQVGDKVVVTDVS